MRFVQLYELDEKNQCTCSKGADCGKSSGKHPKHLDWKERQYLPTPGDQFGVMTGSASGVVIVDQDSEDAREFYLTTYAPPATFEVQTSPGHYQSWFTIPAGAIIGNDVGRKLGHLRLDIRGENGLGVCPPSRHYSGGRYTALNNLPPAPLPANLLTKMQMDASERRAASAFAPTPIDINTEEGQNRIASAFKFCDEDAPPAVQGQNGSGALWNVMGHLVRTLQLPVDAAVQIAKEIYNPRCSPPWSDRELLHKAEDQRDLGTWLPGPMPEGMMGRLAKSQQTATKAPVRSTRKTHDPKHVYTCTPGDRPNGQKTKITLAQAVAELSCHADWEGCLQWDDFRRRVTAVDPPIKLNAENVFEGLTEKDGIAVSLWFEIQDSYLISPDIAWKAALMASDRNVYHSVKEYLAAVGEAKTGVLDTLAARALGATDPQANEFLKKTLVAAVRRIRSPGTKMDTVLVLVGPQGARKSSFIKFLFGPQFTRSQMPELSNKDASAALNGFWAIELAELSRILNTPSSTVKEFLTRDFDDYRPPYGKTDGRFARQCVLLGSTNDDDFLSDASGNRRYWPIQCGDRIDIAYVIQHRDEIWAEAAALESEGYQHYFQDDNSVNASRTPFMASDAWEDPIRNFLRGRQETTTQEVYEGAILRGDRDLTKLDTKTQMRVADLLKKIGCRKTKNGAGRNVWKVEAGIAADAPANPLKRLKSPGSEVSVN